MKGNPTPAFGDEDHSPLVFVLGTRPEAIKLAPVISLAIREARRPVLVALTDQHVRSADDALESFGLNANERFGGLSPGRSLVDLSVHVTRSTAELLLGSGACGLVVQGDTTSAFSAALAGFYEGVPVFHVEAGLRTGDRLSPYPEEANRRMIAALASLHLAPTPAGREALLREGVPERDIVLVGNTVVDAARICLDRPRHPTVSGLLQGRLKAEARVLVTIHRRESWNEMASIIDSLRALCLESPYWSFIVMRHPNPELASYFDQVADVPNVYVMDPLPYDIFIQLMAEVDFVVTDSGGIQEEAASMRIPMAIVRDSTERSEVLLLPNTQLVSRDLRLLRSALKVRETVLAGRGSMEQERTNERREVLTRSAFGDGYSAERILSSIEEYLGNGVRES